MLLPGPIFCPKNVQYVCRRCHAHGPLRSRVFRRGATRPKEKLTACPPAAAKTHPWGKGGSGQNAPMAGRMHRNWDPAQKKAAGKPAATGRSERIRHPI
jgi:ribosomal protein L40E